MSWSPTPWPRHGLRPGPGPGSRIYSPIPDANADTKAPKYFLVASKRNCLWKFMITIFMSHCIFHMLARGCELRRGRGRGRPHVGMVHGLWLLNECRMRFIYVTRRLAIAFHGLLAAQSGGKWQVASCRWQGGKVAGAANSAGHYLKLLLCITQRKLIMIISLECNIYLQKSLLTHTVLW